MSFNTLVDPETEDRLVPLLANLLDQVLSANEGLSGLPQQKIPATLISFHAFRAPNIAISDYLERIYEFSCCSPACLVIAMVYIERLMAKQLPTEVPLTKFNVHRIVVTAVLLATKFLEDVHYDNSYWAKVAGIAVRELNKLEVEFLQALDWRLDVSDEVFGQYFWGLLSTDPTSIAHAKQEEESQQEAEEGEDQFYDAPDEVQAAAEVLQNKGRLAEERLSPTRRSYSEDIAKSLATYRVPCC